MSDYLIRHHGRIYIFLCIFGGLLLTMTLPFFFFSGNSGVFRLPGVGFPTSGFLSYLSWFLVSKYTLYNNLLESLSCYLWMSIGSRSSRQRSTVSGSGESFVSGGVVECGFFHADCCGWLLVKWFAVILAVAASCGMLF